MEAATATAAAAASVSTTTSATSSPLPSSSSLSPPRPPHSLPSTDGLPIGNSMIPDLNLCAPLEGIEGPGTADECEKGLSCHQCRQKTVGLAALCTNARRNRACRVRICRSCLMNRYGERVEEVHGLESWKCPKCRGVCNCSICMKRRGKMPTGILTHTAKAMGFCSVAEMLLNTNLVNTEESLLLSSINARGDSSRIIVPNEGAEQEIERDKLDCGIPHETLIEVKDDIEKTTRTPIPNEDVVALLPEGEELRRVADIQFHEHDVGPALQFLEFCLAFGKVFDLEKGQPEAILEELSGGNVVQSGIHSCAVRLHVKLLDLLQADEKSSILHSSATGFLWLQSLHRFISKSPYMLKELPPDYLDMGPDGYFTLDSSKKIRILNVLCDEALGTEHLRILIDEENEKFWEEKKEYQKNLVEMNKKEKDAKQKLKDEMTLRSSKDALLAENHDIICNLKKEIGNAHSEKLKALELSSRFKKQRSDAVRTEPLFVHNSGRVLWRLGADSVISHVILQDLGSWDSPSCEDKWFIYDSNQEKELEKVFLSLRKRKRKRQRAPETVRHGDEEKLQDELLNNLTLLSDAIEEAML